MKQRKLSEQTEIKKYLVEIQCSCGSGMKYIYSTFFNTNCIKKNMAFMKHLSLNKN